MKAIEDGVKALQRLQEKHQMFYPTPSEYRNILKQVVRKALQEVLDGFDK